MTKLDFVKAVKESYLDSTKKYGLCKWAILVSLRVDKGVKEQASKHKDWFQDEINKEALTKMHLYDLNNSAIVVSQDSSIRRIDRYYLWNRNDYESRVEFLDSLIIELENNP